MLAYFCWVDGKRFTSSERTFLASSLERAQRRAELAWGVHPETVVLQSEQDKFDHQMFLDDRKPRPWKYY